MNVLIATLVSLLAALMAVNGQSSSPTTSPSAVPTRAPTTSSPTRSPSNPVLTFAKVTCPTQTFGTDVGSTLLTSQTADGTNFTGNVVRGLVAGRSASTVTVYESSTAVQKIIAQFATQFPGNGQLGQPGGPNITWNTTRYGFTTAPSVLRQIVYAPREVAVLYSPYLNGANFSTADKLKFKWIKTSNFALGSEVDVGLTEAEVGSFLRFHTGYYVAGMSSAGVINCVRSISTFSGGKSTFSFVRVNPSTEAGKIPATPLTSPASFSTAIDSRGILMFGYTTSGNQIAINMFNSSLFFGTREQRALIPLLGGGADDQPARISMVSPAAGTFALAYNDRYAMVGKIILTYTEDNFATFTAPASIGFLQVPRAAGSSSNPSISLIWTSNNTINVWEFDAPRGQAWARPWIWYRMNETGPTRFNSTFGYWAQSSTNMYQAATNMSSLAVSTQTSYGYNIFGDTGAGINPKRFEVANCMVYTFINTTRSAASLASIGFSAIVASLLAVVVATF